MATITFDTLKYVEKLKAAGVPELQAKAEAEVSVSAFSETMDAQWTPNGRPIGDKKRHKPYRKRTGGFEVDDGNCHGRHLGAHHEGIFSHLNETSV